jgi:dolichyl-phosphate-mannose--protein O-mannosyl transferase
LLLISRRIFREAIYSVTFVFLGNPLIQWPALIAVAIRLRDWIVKRRADAFLVSAFYLGPYIAWVLLPRTLGFLYCYLPAATTASLALVYPFRRGSTLRWLSSRTGSERSRCGRRRHSPQRFRPRRDPDK